MVGGLNKIQFSIQEYPMSTCPTLYQYEACPFCWKVRVLMDYKGIPCKVEEVNPLNKKEIAFSEGYKKVPILIDADGRQVNDSNEIMRHLDKLYPDRKLFTGDDQEKQWMDWSDQKLVRALPPLIYQSYGAAVSAFDYITKNGKFSWLQQRMIKYSGAFVMTMVAKKSAKGQGISNPQLHVIELLREWGAAVAKDDFLGGEKPNGADMSIYGVLKAIENLPSFELVKGNPQVYHWYQRMGSAAKTP